MSENGRKIREHLEIFQHDLSIGLEKYDYQYSQNETISCIKCGKIKYK